MRQNRLIAIFTYLLLIAGCMGIVFIADKAAGTGPFYHTKKEAESDLPDDGKVGDGSGISSGRHGRRNRSRSFSNYTVIYLFGKCNRPDDRQ